MKIKKSSESALNKRKKWPIVVSVIVILLLAAVVGVMFSPIPDIIRSLSMSASMSDEDIRNAISETNARSQEELDKRGITVRDLNEDEKAKLVSGELTEEEITEILTAPPEDQVAETKPSEIPDDEPISPAQQVAEDKKQSDDNDKTAVQDGKGEHSDTVKPSETKPAGTDASLANEELAKQIAKVYVLKARMQSGIEGIIASLKAEYLALPKERRRASIAGFGSRGLSQVAALEAQSDSEMEAILAEITRILTESGQDLSLVDSIRSAYQEEKSYTKAYYVNRYAGLS